MGVRQCAHVAFVCFFVHVHALPFLLDGTVKKNDGAQSIFPGLCSCLVIVTTVLSLLREKERLSVFVCKITNIIFKRNAAYILK